MFEEVCAILLDLYITFTGMMIMICCLWLPKGAFSTPGNGPLCARCYAGAERERDKGSGHILLALKEFARGALGT